MVRVKWRYVLVKVITEASSGVNGSTLTQGNIYEAIRKSVRAVHGDVGLALLQKSLKIKYINVETATVLVRCYRSQCLKLLQAVALVKRIGDADAFFCTVHVSGTIRTCFKYLARYLKRYTIILIL